jgi:hypothetical protein
LASDPRLTRPPVTPFGLAGARTQCRHLRTALCRELADDDLGRGGKRHCNECFKNADERGEEAADGALPDLHLLPNTRSRS